MLQVCRTCLQEVADLNYISLGDATSLTESLKVKDVLSICVPELALDIIVDPVMCAACMTSLHVAYDFKRKCLRTEERIRSYVHSLVLGSKDVDIIAMMAQGNDKGKGGGLTGMNGEDLPARLKIENSANKLEICVKDEPHSSDDEATKDQSNNTASVAEGKFIYSNLTNSWEDVAVANSEPHDTNSGLSSINTDSNLHIISGEPGVGQWLRKALESPRKQHVCSICKKIFDRRSSLYLHRKIHELDRPFKCTMCNYSATQRVNLITHVRGHTGEKPYTCDQCSFRTAHHSSIKHHMRVHTGKKPYSCSKCDFHSSFKYSLVAHLKVHEVQNPFKCGQCGFRTNEESALLEHAKSHPDSSKKCTKCDFIAEHPEELRKHLKNHGRQKCFKCNECDYSTAVKCNLQRHQVVHGGQKTLKCNTCSFVTSTSSRLRCHVQLHTTNNRPRLYKCQECSFISPDEKKVRIHAKIHNMGQKPFKCFECEYTASCRLHLIKHMRTHTGEKPYKCVLCDFTASHNFSLKRHMTVHSDDKPFKCPMCNYMAKRRTYLLDHIRTHTGEKPYKCHRCNYSALRKPLLLAHFKTHEEIDGELNLVINTSYTADKATSGNKDKIANEEIQKVILEEPCETFGNEGDVSKQILSGNATNIDALTST